MKKSRKFIIILFAILLSVLMINFFFYIKLNELKRSTVASISHVNSSIKDAIVYFSNNLPRLYFENRIKNDNITEVFISNINKYKGVINTTFLWNLTNSWVSNRYLVNHVHEYTGEIYAALKYSPILKADLDYRGSQLKFLLTLKGNQEVIFKPMWYYKEKILKGPIYGGKDRHTSEIIAFYMSVILNLPFVPFCVERKISMKDEILPVASKQFLQTTYFFKNKTCTYGKCFYCSKRDPICSDQFDVITGAVIFNIKNKLKLSKSPWMRTYKVGKFAEWEQNDLYCDRTVRNRVTKNRISEMVDTAIFDFFIQNGDRHHYEIMDGQILLLDNGKGLGNPFEHQIDILAPLYQCCVLKKKTWRKLLTLSNNKISHYLKKMPDVEDFLSEDHLKAIDIRLSLVFGAIEHCNFKKRMIFV